MRPWMQAAMTYFYPRSPCGERHGAELDIHHNFPISIHALLAESDSAGQAEKPGNRDFYPRSPCGERPSARSLVASLSRQFLSTLSLRRATAGQFCPGRTFQISIHALLAESDRHCADTLWFRRHISIHALLAESDLTLIQKLAHLCLFLSTLSLRRATGELQSMPRVYRISIHALLAESDGINRVKRLLPTWISIHALLAESDDNYIYNVSIGNISIHALLAESDLLAVFSPILRMLFLSTLSLRRATSMRTSLFCGCSDFYPRSPCGERLDLTFHKTRCINFYPRSPCGERHEALEHPIASPRHFYPRSPCGERLPYQRQIDQKSNFYPRSPCGERPCPSPC